jgi:DNA-binding NarL/FixJ family response regulator
MSPHLRTLIVADDHPLFRAALHKCLLQTFGEITVVEAGDFPALQARLLEHPDADLLLLDLYMPGTQGFSGLSFVNARYPQLPVVVISANEKPGIMREAVACGAAGFLPKSASATVIAEGLAKVLAGEIWLPEGLDMAGADAAATDSALTPQQQRVAQMLVQGLQNKQIAAAMQVTEATVKAHMTAILRKLGVTSRTQAVLALQALELKASR